MKPPSKASVVKELLLAHGAESAGLSASAPCATSGHVCGIKLGKTVVLSDLGNLSASTSFVTPGRQRGGVSGVSISPDGSYIAAFSSDELYVAEMQSAGSGGSLHHVAQLAGIKAVHWCHNSTALAVCCKQQADINLLVLQSRQQQSEAPAAAQQPAFTLAPLQRLPGPRSATAGARCAAWLPQSEPGGPAALLAAWPSDLLVYTWAPAEEGVDWSRHKVHRFLAGWPGPVRSIAVAACPGSSDSSLILGTVDAQLSLGFNNHNSSTLESIGIKPVSTAAQQQATQESAAKELTGCSNRSGSPLEGTDVLRVRPSLITPLRHRAAADTSNVKEPSPSPAAAVAAVGTSRLSSLLQSTGVLRASSSSLITLLQPEAGAAATSSDKQPAAAQIDAGAEAKSVSAAVVHPSPYPDVDDLLTPRSLAQPVEPTGLSVGSSAGGSGGGSVLSSLMNITAQPAGRSCRNDGAGFATITSSMSSSSGGDGSACLCMLQVRVPDFCSITTSSNSTSNSPSSAHSPGSNAGVIQSSHQQSSGPLSNKAAKSSRRRLYSSALQLPHLPTPDLLALHDCIAAVGSSTGQPLVTLCSFAAPAQGLQLLQTVAIPLPSPYAQDALVKARLEGLLLTPAGKKQHRGLATGSSSNAGTRYPRISDGCLAGALDEDVIVYNSSSSGNEPQPLPDVVALLSCFEVQQQGNFANIGSKAASKTADVFLMKCAGPQDIAQKTVPQYSRQTLMLLNQQLPHQQNVQAADELVPLRFRMSASGSTAAAAAVREGPVEDCIWWRSAVQQAENDKHQQKDSGPSQQQPSSAGQTLQQQQQQQQEQQQEQQGNSSICQQPSSAAHMLQKLKQQEQKQLEQFTRHRELKHPSVVPGVGVGRSVSVETVGSYVSNGTTWTSLTEDYIHPQQHTALHAHCQYHHQHHHQHQPIQRQLQEHDDEFQAAVTRVNKVVAVLSSGQAKLGHHLPAAQQPDDAAGPAAPACSRPSDLDSVVCPVGSVLHRAAMRSAPGYSGLTAAESAGLSRAQSRPLHHVELHSELTFRPVPGSSGLSTGTSPDKPAVLTADQAVPSATHGDADSVQHQTGAHSQGGAVELHCLQRQLQLLQAREQARDEAASRIAVAGLQTSLEQRLDALLQLQQQQLQQQGEMHRQQQKLLLAQAERESALASVLASFHTSMENRLDGVQELMRQMIKQLDRLATGIEEMEGS